MVTAKRKYELQRQADKRAVALSQKTAKLLLAKTRKETENIKRKIAAEKAKQAILSKSRRKKRKR